MTASQMFLSPLLTSVYALGSAMRLDIVATKINERSAESAHPRGKSPIARLQSGWPHGQIVQFECPAQQRQPVEVLVYQSYFFALVAFNRFMLRNVSIARRRLGDLTCETAEV
jgi:hypothetical protein